MSKVFEEEYRQLAESDLPDLWDRIEAGLSPRTVTAPSCPDAVVKPAVSSPEDKSLPSEETVQSAPKRGILTRLRRRPGRYAGLIAACLCAAVIIPAAINAGRNNGRQFSAEAPAADMAAGQMAETAAAEEAVPAAEEAAAPIAEEAAAAAEEPLSASEEAAAPEAPAADMTDEADGAVPATDTNSVDTEVSQSGNATLGTSPERESASDGTGETAPAGELPQEEKSAEEVSSANQQQTDRLEEAEMIRNKFAAGTVIKAVSFKVTAVTETDSPVIYRATVTEEAGGLLAADEEITFIKKAGVKTDITVGKSYQADLYYCAGEDYLFAAGEIRLK